MSVQRVLLSEVVNSDLPRSRLKNEDTSFVYLKNEDTTFVYRENSRSVRIGRRPRYCVLALSRGFALDSHVCWVKIPTG